LSLFFTNDRIVDLVAGPAVIIVVLFSHHQEAHNGEEATAPSLTSPERLQSLYSTTNLITNYNFNREKFQPAR
jgi:hypothetical protein